uniref:Homeobox domain-containing protein n=1 Tax=Euplotes harpa TaxID=151035 RepID=A0A7S3J9Z3_9SPIT|mmetsp:Transcript_25672/g.29515  ORF Transcript_25672/g.29515 Transcript_25672/m.29515 type:complete len:303 (+) Transcript_25672:22-930(+)
MQFKFQKPVQYAVSVKGDTESCVPNDDNDIILGGAHAGAVDSLNATSLKNGKFAGSMKNSNGKTKNSRMIKDGVQLQLLEKFFSLDPEWSKETITFIMTFMDLTRLQLYKWGYDQKRKSSYKKGIRNKTREYKRVTSCREVKDYNSIVNQLFIDEQPNASNPEFLRASLESLRDEYLASGKLAPKQPKALSVESKSTCEEKSNPIAFIFHDDSPSAETSNTVMNCSQTHAVEKQEPIPSLFKKRRSILFPGNLNLDYEFDFDCFGRYPELKESQKMATGYDCQRVAEPVYFYENNRVNLYIN